MRESWSSFSTGISSIDAVTGGVRSGTLWAIVGMRGVGVTELALQICLAAAVRDSRRSNFVNSHLPLMALRGRAAAIVHRSTTDPGVAAAPLDALDAARLDFGLDLRRDDPADAMFKIQDVVRDLDLLVLDTLDEAIVGSIPAGDRQPDLISDLRTLRAANRHAPSAILATARVAPLTPQAVDVTHAWRRHPLHESVMDTADVVITLSEPSHAMLRADVDVRGKVVRPVELTRASEPWSTLDHVRWD